MLCVHIITFRAVQSVMALCDTGWGSERTIPKSLTPPAPRRMNSVDFIAEMARLVGGICQEEVLIVARKPIECAIGGHWRADFGGCTAASLVTVGLTNGHREARGESQIAGARIRDPGL